MLAVETTVIVAASLVSGIAYHHSIYGETGPIMHFAGIGLLTAVLFAAPGIYRDDYQIHHFLARARKPGQVFLLWNMTFLMLAAIAFLSKTTGNLSRGWVLLFHPLGLLALTMAERRIAEMIENGLASGRIGRSRALIIGAHDRITAFESHAAWESSVEIALTLEWPPLKTGGKPETCTEALDKALARTAARARTVHVETVVLLLDWSETDLIDRITAAFIQLPVSVHVVAHDTLRHYPLARVSDVAGRITLRLTDPPLTPWQEATKRVLDTFAAGLGLIALSPLLIAAAIAIKLDSPGPIFFRQRRRGFNHREFLIWKFRTMTTLDDGDVIVQASKGDQRITRVGRWLRRFNIDELPQLINVLKGEMSLVGPRPHAVAHDRLYETCIAEYPRRLNMLPGITGWAQVNGCRGETETEDRMRRRVELDVYYIQNWSLSFDLYIMALTVLSPSAYRNAH